MPTNAAGFFSYIIPAADLAKGIRPSKRVPRDTKFLTKCTGAVGIDNVLSVLDDISEDAIDTSTITDNFPYPQLFVFTNIIIVCAEDEIFELIGGVLTSVLDAGDGIVAGITWSAIDLFDYVYMSNGAVAVIRRASDKVWEVTTDQPTASSICNFNGQVMIGAPDVDFS